jgi:hypothetical protein
LAGDTFRIINEYQRTVVTGPHDKTAADIFDEPRRREAALRHGWIKSKLLSKDKARRMRRTSPSYPLWQAVLCRESDSMRCIIFFGATLVNITSPVDNKSALAIQMAANISR